MNLNAIPVLNLKITVLLVNLEVIEKDLTAIVFPNIINMEILKIVPLVPSCVINVKRTPTNVKMDVLTLPEMLLP